MTTEILVCVLCRPPELPRDRPRPGRALFEAIENIALRDHQPFPIRPVECMSGCRRHCAVALQAPGKTTYMFGDLPPTTRVPNRCWPAPHSTWLAPTGSWRELTTRTTACGHTGKTAGAHRCPLNVSGR